MTTRVYNIDLLDQAQSYVESSQWKMILFYFFALATGQVIFDDFSELCEESNRKFLKRLQRNDIY